MPTVATLVAWLEQFAPSASAADWDNVGLLLGDQSTNVQRLMTCLTVTSESAAEAVAEDVQLIVSHHPILFKAVHKLTADTVEGRLVLDLSRAGVAVYSPHSAFDNTCGGINDVLAQLLELQHVRPMVQVMAREAHKLVVFVPDKDLGRMMDALFAAGAGQIGQYRECSYRLAGTGTFFATDATHPSVGMKGQREEVSEWRLEVVCPTNSLNNVVAAMRQAHSYEEPAYDIYPLQPAPAAQQGEGRLGELVAPVLLRTLAELVRSKLSSGPVQVVGDLQRSIERVGIVCGAGGSFVSQAVRAGADVLLTGEARFHEYLAAQAKGLALVLPGHHATERIGVEHLARRLQQAFPDVKVWPSRRERDPAAWV